MGRLPLALTLCSVLALPQYAAAQAQPNRSGIVLAPFVQDAIEAGLPPTAEVSARIWEGRSAADHISKAEFEKRYELVLRDHRREAYQRLQPVENLFNQLNSLETIMSCGVDVRNGLHTLLENAMGLAPSWANLSASWTSLSAKLSCISGDLSTSPGEPIPLVRDTEVRTQLLKVIGSVKTEVADVSIAIKAKDQAGLICSARILSNQLNQFYFVMAIQMAILTNDMHELLPTKGTTSEPSMDFVHKLERLIEQSRDN
jgi:hypothetical protein